MIVAVDGSRIRSGGGIAHLKGMINSYDPTSLGYKKVFLWAIRDVIDSIPEYSWLIKIPFEYDNSNILIQLYWQRFILPKLCISYKVDLLVNLDAGSVAKYFKMVTISQDMLSFEPGQMKKYFFSFKWLRLIILKYVQISSLNASKGRIFLTNYARDVINKFLRSQNESCIIPHGIDEIKLDDFSSFVEKDVYNLVYVSNIAPYKNHLSLISAIEKLDELKIKINLTLIGGGVEGSYKRLVYKQINRIREKGICIKNYEFLNREKVFELINQNDIFIFASSCENMPITLLEGMIASKPILCSNRGPMPEVLGSFGLYFDPENFNSIVNTVIEFKKMPLVNKNKMILGAYNSAKKYRWRNSSKLMWEFVKKIIIHGN